VRIMPLGRRQTALIDEIECLAHHGVSHVGGAATQADGATLRRRVAGFGLLAACPLQEGRRVSNTARPPVH
jgi:hypothetical protein